MRGTLPSVVDTVVPTPRPPLPTDAVIGLQLWYEQWPWIVATCIGFQILLHFAHVWLLRRQLQKSHASLKNFQNETAALKQEIKRLNDAAAEKAMRQSENAQRRAEYDVKDYENQIRFIEQSIIAPKHVLNHEENAIFGHCLAVTREFRTLHSYKLNVCPQVSMGEMLRTRDDEFSRTYSSFNSKRVDILICDDSWNPLIVIEHQGSGHTVSDDWAERDHIKARALERAGVRRIETGPEHCARAREEFKTTLQMNLLDVYRITPPALTNPPNTSSESDGVTAQTRLLGEPAG
jgi:hypothetical protein